jgi:hypothetical protein
MTLADVRDWLKSFNLFQNYYIGCIDAKKNNSLGVYNLTGDNARREVVGDLKIFDKKSISLLIHGDKNKTNTELLAFKLYDRLEALIKEQAYVKIGNTDIYFIALLNNEPVDVDKDESGVYEYVIELNIYFKK